MSGEEPLLESSGNGVQTVPEIENRSKDKRLLYFLLTIIMITLVGMLGLFSSFITYVGGLSATSNNILQHQQGQIQKSCLETHLLYRNENARKASRKLYELLCDFDDSIYDEDNMILGGTKMYPNTYSKQPYVSNGYIGSRIPNIGFGYAVDTLNLWTNSGEEIPGALDNGWPLRNRRYAGAFVSDFYCLQEKLNSTNFPELDDRGYTTVISAIPQWTNLQFSINDSIWFNPQNVNVNDVTNYNQNLSMRNGVVTTQLDWLNGMINVRSEVATHKKIYSLGMLSLEISLNLAKLPADVPHIDLNIYDFLDFGTSHRTVLRDLGFDKDKEGIYMVVEPENVPESNAAIFSTCIVEDPAALGNFSTFDWAQEYSNNERIAQSSHVRLTRTSPKTIIRKYVGIMSSEFNKIDANDVSNIEFATTIATGNRGKFEELIASNTEAWERIYNDAFIEIPSDALLEMTARSSLFHLLANTRTFNVSDERGLPVPVSGLSSDSYGGMVFWDADIWIQPAVLPFFPNIAKNINNYRNATHQQARENARLNGYPGAVYPWTSGRYANCTSSGPCVDYEYHVNIDIALASFSIYMNGAEGIDDDYLRYTTWPILKDAADFFAAYVKFNETLGKYETYNLTDPDEFANHINNGAFTNAGIKTMLKWATDIGNHLGEYVDPKWLDISKRIYIPRSCSNITLEYSGMNSSIEIKQADVPLMVYPLGYITDESILNNAIKDLYYYSERQSATGPAMTYPVFVAAAAGMLNHGSSSQSYLYKSVLPYLRGPFAQFSEQSDDNFLTNGLTQPAFPFLTANGGFLQAILFGLTGLRYSYEVDETTKKISRLLRFSPIEMPLLPGGIAIRNFKYMGQVLDIIIDDYNGTIIHKSGDADIRVKVPDRSLIRDRDIARYEGPNTTHHEGCFNDYSEEGGGDKPVSAFGTYYTIKPGQELVLPLFRPALNVPGNVVESKQVTNLTAGVPGDVPFSALDGNNYTHWQPANKYKPAKLLIDLGEDNFQEIKSGIILWGRRPAQNVTVAILPHASEIERLFSNLTEVLETTDVDLTKDEEITEVLEDAGEDISEIEVDACDEDIAAIVSWKTNGIEGFLESLKESHLLSKHFVRIVDNLQIQPSEPYFQEVYNQSLIELLPTNVTEFYVDYDSLQLHESPCCFEESINSTEWRKTRFILVTIQGSYDDDIDIRGGTIKEIVLKN
ncbi:hypothetical protein HG537_0B04250 [Torulaspora globosa]|uniref:alpha,alpha-trehalase n=1 Tax=Torulaspora globosa TaxID=48254 RepID=A0A7H9HQY6_9SACH|nr:hypothetical protein HG537_0B04250 [Torulaspora sp. CBS 2947]